MLAMFHLVPLGFARARERARGDLLNSNPVRQSDSLAILKRDNIIRHDMRYSG